MISKLLPRHSLCFSKETVPFSICLLFILLPVTTFAQQLENWRYPFYIISSEMGRTASAPSRMFWDRIESANLFDSSIWLSSEKAIENHWFMEPHVKAGLEQPSKDDQSTGYYHLEMLNDIRFRRFLIRQTFDVDKRYEYDSYYPAHQQRNLRGRIEEAYAQVDWKYGFFRIGRQKRNWGPFADRSLFISSNPYSYDAVEWQISSSAFEFRHLFAPLPNSRGWDSDNGSTINRFLTAHSLNVMFGEWVTVGLSESVVFTREKSFPDLHYINPVALYSLVNMNQEGNGNLMLAFQWNIHPFIKSVSFKGQVVIDDFQIDDELVTDKEPTHYGLDMGVYWTNPFNIPFEHYLKAEYRKFSEWMYTVTDENGNIGERYTYAAKSLGAPQNDGDRLNTGFTVIGKNHWYGSAELGFSRQGIRNVLSRWQDSEPGQTQGLPKDSSYSIEKTFSTALNAGFYFKNLADLSIGLSGNWIKNKDNISEPDYKFSPSVSIELSLHYSNLFFKLPQ